LPLILNVDKEIHGIFTSLIWFYATKKESFQDF
jgi:hypothetical protein